MAISVLVVDDERTVAGMLAAVLKTEGYEVATAASTADAVAMLRTRAFDVVITDMRMESNTSGYDVARAASAQTQDPAIILLTGYPMPAREWRQSGAHAMLQKPAPIPRLLETIERTLAERAQRRRERSDQK